MEKLNLVKHKFDELPNNIEAEQAVLGSILVTNEIVKIFMIRCIRKYLVQSKN